MSVELAAAALSAVLTSLLARRTTRGQAQVILSEADYNEFLAKTECDLDLDRVVRKQLAHSTAIALDDGEFRATLHRVFAEMSAHRHDDAAGRPSTGCQHNDAWLQSAILDPESPLAEIQPIVGEPALALAESFLDQMVRTGDEVVAKLDIGEAERLGRLAADQVIAGARWSQIVGDRIDTTTASDLLAISRQALAKRQASGSLLGLPGHGTTWYPIWQFDIEAETIRPEVRDIVGTFRDAVGADVDPYLIAAWAAAEQAEDLEGASPANWLISGRDVRALREAARRAAERLAQ